MDEQNKSTRNIIERFILGYSQTVNPNMQLLH